MPKLIPGSRPLSQLTYDTKRTLRNRTASWVAAYLGRQAIKILVANQTYYELTGDLILAPSIVKAMELLRQYAREEVPSRRRDDIGVPKTDN